MQKLFNIHDVFDIEGKGTVIMGVSEIGESEVALGTPVCVRNASAVMFEGSVLDKELMRNCFSPEKPRSLALLISREHVGGSIPRGAEAWLKK
jgi:hypothetical protein